MFKKNLSHKILSFHCIIHQEGLCAQTFPSELSGVMGIVIKIVNLIMAKGLNHRQFCEFLKEIDHKYTDLLLNNKVRWLSKGKVLCRFSDCLPAIKLWLEENEIIYLELSDDDWLEMFYFLTDLMTHFNQLNIKLQGTRKTAINLLEEVLSFENKLNLFANDIINCFIFLY